MLAYDTDPIIEIIILYSRYTGVLSFLIIIREDDLLCKGALQTHTQTMTRISCLCQAETMATLCQRTTQTVVQSEYSQEYGRQQAALASLQYH